jgi:hypothetical protein
MKNILIRDVTQEECSWLDRDYKKGEVVYEYYGYTYGCIGRGVAFTETSNETPFFELPRNSVKEVKEIE